MVTDKQVRRLMKLINTEDTIATAASKAGMDEKTARKYFRLEKLPSEIARPHTWRTRKDPFEDVCIDCLFKFPENRINFSSYFT